MATKTFKIGENSCGGVITAETTKTKVTIILKEWDMSQGTRRSSDQTNAKEFNRFEVSVKDSEAYRKLQQFLEEDTTYFYACTIMDWIKTKVDIKRNIW
jgi:hypothetical protein